MKPSFRRLYETWKRTVLYTDRAIIVLNKPPGLVCQPTSNSRRNELGKISAPVRDNDLNFVLHKLEQLLSLPCLPYPVHRLDKGTTGALVMARSASSARDLSQQFQQRTIGKTYLALVRGGEKSFPSKAGQVRDAIKYINGRGQIHSDGKFSATDWELVASSPIAPVSLIRLKLLTGQKHQLRLHLAYSLRTPILGDDIYSKKRTSEAVTSQIQLPNDRIFLHASEISLYRYRPAGPRKRFCLSVRAPLPEDFIQVCKKLDIPVEYGDLQGGAFIDGTHVESGSLLKMD